MTDDDLRPPEEPRNAADALASSSGAKPNSKLWLLLGIVVSALLLVVLVLPAIVPEPGSKAPEAVVKALSASPNDEASDAIENEQYRHDAEKSLQAFLHSRANPDLDNAEIWAEADWQGAMTKADDGDKEFGRGNFFTALQNYQAANLQLQAILNSRAQILQTNLQLAWQLLQTDEIDEAIAAFELVIAMQADHSDALLGLKRASVRAQVLDLVTKAQQAVIINKLQLAADTYRQALGLDPLHSVAQTGLFEVEEKLRQQAFQVAMGQALQALDNEQFAAAEKALITAAKISPNNASITDLGERLTSARRQARLKSLRSQAEQSAADENWDTAATKYRTALAINSQAAFAQHGLERAQKKQQIHKQLDHYLADSTRLYSDDPLENARKLLAANPPANSGEPKLTGKLEKLQQYVTLAAIPVEVLLVSDNLTQVTIYKVGRLGVFEQKQLSLKPGKYTVTGSRKGYRDVHQVFELRPGMKELSVQVFAEEQI